MMDMKQVPPFDEVAYRRWLSRNTTLSGRSLSDTVSRTRRVLGITDLSRAENRDHVQMALLGNATFKACSVSVRSQLKRAASLYVGFKQVGDA